MRVGILGINFKLADLKLRETLARACQRRFGPENSVHGDQLFVLLSTCNRTELYFTSPELSATHTYILDILRREIGEDFDQKVYTYFGHDCFMHLCRVTSGLDSAIVAETEIQGQVKSAYENAVAFMELPSEMHFLFQKCLKTGKKIRSEYPLKPGLPNLEHALMNIGGHFFKDPLSAQVLIVGASEINKKILSFLKNKNISRIALCNRTDANAKRLAVHHGIEVLPWKDLEQWVSFDWIITGTKASEYLLTKHDLIRTIATPKLVIDLSVPRNVDPSLARHEGITLMNIDQINRTLKIRRQQVNHTIVQAESYVVKSTQVNMEIFRKKNLLKKDFVSPQLILA